MQRSSSIINRGILATDGPVGSISDLLFDDAFWGVRWVVVDTGNWLPGREVLLPPAALGAPDPGRPEYPVGLTRESVKNAPGVEMDKPVSRQLEADIYSHYAWNPYWVAGYGYPDGIAGMGATAPPSDILAAGASGGRPGERSGSSRSEPEGDPHLRSVREVTGYYVKATDGDIGHVEDFMVEGEDWAVRYLMIDTRNWWPGKLVLISPEWLSDIDWAGRAISVEVTREKVKNSPEYDPSNTLARSYEEDLYHHYGYSPYWSGGLV